MKRSQKSKIIGLLCILGAITLLSGCVTNTDQTDKNSTAGAGYTGALPWDNLPVLTTLPPAGVTSTLGISPVTTQTLPPFASGIPLNLPSPSFGLVTPTPILSGVATMIPIILPTISPLPAVTPLVLKLGSTGTAVRNMQTRLKTLDYLTGTADGDFGKATEIALKDFQARNGLTADGIAGPATLTRLNSNAAVKARVTPKPTAVPPKATATPNVNTNTYMRQGDQGSEVHRLQDRLISLGYLAGKSTGYFDGATEAAVIDFQKRNVSYYDGVAGPMTLSALYSSNARRASTQSATIGISLRKGDMDSDAVRTMQRRLKELRYYTGEIDGDFGTSTEIAVKAFQTVNKLKVDGVAGEGTLNLLYSTAAKRADSTSLSTPVPGGQVTPAPAFTPILIYVNVTPDPLGNYVTLRPGHSGVLVTNLQQALKTKGYLQGIVDGKYGLGTIDAVMRFQADNGLSQDGMAGPATQRVLFEGDFPIGS